MDKCISLRMNIFEYYDVFYLHRKYIIIQNIYQTIND